MKMRPGPEQHHPVADKEAQESAGLLGMIDSVAAMADSGDEKTKEEGREKNKLLCLAWLNFYKKFANTFEGHPEKILDSVKAMERAYEDLKREIREALDENKYNKNIIHNLLYKNVRELEEGTRQSILEMRNYIQGGHNLFNSHLRKYFNLAGGEEENIPSREEVLKKLLSTYKANVRIMEDLLDQLQYSYPDAKRTKEIMTEFFQLKEGQPSGKENLAEWYNDKNKRLGILVREAEKKLNSQ